MVPFIFNRALNYLTPCINRFNKGCNTNEMIPKPIGINVYYFIFIKNKVFNYGYLCL